MRVVRICLALMMAAAIPGVPAAYARHRLHCWRHFRVVKERRLYRSGQLSPAALDEVIHDYGIKTIVCLRCLAREGDSRLEDDEERECAARGIRYVRFSPAPWDSPTTRENLRTFLDIVDDSTAGPVLIHCFAGLHRTGVYCAVFRMERDGWSNDEAVAEMIAVGHCHEDPSALTFLREYVPGKRIGPAGNRGASSK